MFVRKRDPRHKSHLAHQARLNQSKANGPSASSSRSTTPKRAQSKNTSYVEQEWQKVTKDHQHDDLEWAAVEGEDSQEWECVACGKSFKSEAAWDSHERSKKHMKEIGRLKGRMMRENEELGLSAEATDDDDEQGEVDKVDGDAVPQPLLTPPGDVQSGDGSDTASVHPSETIDVLEKETVSKDLSKDREQVSRDDEIDIQPQEVASTPRELSKREKRKLREARKAQTAEAEKDAAQVSA